MNVKKAKALRKELGYMPTDAREYHALVVKSMGSKPRVVPTTKVNASTSIRGVYRQQKRERAS